MPGVLAWVGAGAWVLGRSVAKKPHIVLEKIVTEDDFAKGLPY